MLFRPGWAVLIAVSLATTGILAQDTATVAKPRKPAISTEPWPDDDVLLARGAGARNRRLFQDATPLEFTLTADFAAINKQRTPNNDGTFSGNAHGGWRGHPGHARLPRPPPSEVRKPASSCRSKLEFTPEQIAGTVFDGQTTLKLGTHCRDEQEFDQYVMREYLAYTLANLVTPLSFRARLARATYIDARTKKKLSTHSALFLEHENDVARRLGGREVRVPHMVFNDFDRDALTTTMMLEYMLGNTDYSIWALHNVVIVEDKRRRFLPVPYDFDLSGMVHAAYAAPDERLHQRSVTERLYRGPCRTVEEFNAAAEPFRAHEADMAAAIDSIRELNGVHKNEMRDYLESFFRRIATPQAIKRTFVDGCPATRARV